MMMLLPLACSGPGASAAIGRATLYGNLTAGVAFVILLVAAAIYLLVRRNFYAGLLNLTPMIIHPAWTVSAAGGDCGATKIVCSSIFVVIAFGLLVTAIVIAILRGNRDDASSLIQYSIGSLLGMAAFAACMLALLRTEIAPLVPWFAFLILAFFASRQVIATSAKKQVP